MMDADGALQPKRSPFSGVDEAVIIAVLDTFESAGVD